MQRNLESRLIACSLWKGGKLFIEEREYEITIREVLVRRVKCMAESELDALQNVEADYRAGNIVLEADDFSYNEFSSREIIPNICKGR